MAREFDIFGVGSTEPRFRVSRLKESLDIITALWGGEAFDYEGEHFTLRSAQQRPTPLDRIPIVIGGAGKKTMELVATYADWWNLHIQILDRYEEMRPLAGRARPSLQVQTALVGSEARREEIVATAAAALRQEDRGRFTERARRLLRGSRGARCGTRLRLVHRFRTERDRGGVR